MVAKEPRHKGIDERVVQEVQKLPALVNQRPDALVAAAAVLLADPGGVLARGLLLHGPLQDRVLLRRQGVLEERVAEVDNVALDLREVLGRLRQARERAGDDPCRGHGRGGRQQVGELDAERDAALGHGRRVEEGVFEQPVAGLELALVELCNV